MDASVQGQPDDALDIEPRSHEEVTRRAVALAILVRRAALEERNPDGGEQEAFERETDRFELYSWAVKEFGDTILQDERELLRTPAGGLSPEAIDTCLAAILPAEALRWALGLAERLDLLADPDTLVEPLMSWCPVPWEDVTTFARRHTLRPDERLAEERERWELWHWRSTLEPTDHDPNEDLNAVVADVAREAATAGLIQVVEGDFAVDTRPFRALSADERTAIADRAEANLLALNWVCGFGETWDTVPLYPE